MRASSRLLTNKGKDRLLSAETVIEILSLLLGPVFTTCRALVDAGGS